MFVQCIKAFGSSVPGDVIEIPDGSSYSELWFAPTGTPGPEPITPPVPPMA